MGLSLCERRNCCWYDDFRNVCKSPHDPYNNECDYDWAHICPRCEKIIAFDEDDDGCCPWCGAALKDLKESDLPTKKSIARKSERASVISAEENLIEKREWIEGYRDRWYRKIFCCAKCGMKIRTESWDEKRCFGESTILKDNSMPRYCPNCGEKTGQEG